MCKALPKKKKLLVAVSIVLVVLISLTAVLFAVENRVRFAFYSDGVMESLYNSYNPSQVNFIAHRGLSKDVTDNTAEAFRLAAEEDGVYGIETDVWVTKDGQYVCMHDADSVTGFSSPREATLDEILTTPLKVDGVSFAPTFDEYLSICREGNKRAIVELKAKDITNEEIDGIMAAVNASGVEVTYISFNFSMLEYIRSKDADGTLQALVLTGLFTEVDGITGAEARMNKIIETRCDLSILYDFLTKDMVESFHSAGLKVGVWTVDNPKDALILATEYGVDYVTSNIAMKKALDDYSD